MAARAFQPGQFYRLQNYETLAPRGRRHDPGDGRPGADRRVGRPREGPALDDRARDGRLVRSLRAAAAGRAGDPDGPDRHADRDAGRRDRAAGRRRARQRGAVLDRPGAAGRGLARALFRRLQEDRSTATRSRRSRRPPTSSSGAATRRPASRPAAPQDRAFVGNIVEAMAAYGARRARARSTIPLRRGRPPHRDRLGRHDGRGRRRPATACSRRISSPATTPSHHQLADAVHDEGDLRAVPAAPQGSRRPARRPWCSPASTRTRRSTTSISAACARRLSQNGVQEKLTKLWIDRCLRHLGARRQAAE